MRRILYSLYCSVLIIISVFAQSNINHLVSPYEYSVEQIKQQFGTLPEILGRINESHFKMHTVAADDTMEVIGQYKTGGEWINNKRIIASAGIDFESLENFTDSLLNTSSLPEDVFFSILAQPFTAGLYMNIQEWTEEDWRNQYRITTTGDEEERLKTLSMQFWNSSTSSWYYGLLFEYTYDEESRLHQIEIYMGGGEGSMDEGNLNGVMRLTRSYYKQNKPSRDMIAIYTAGNWNDSFRVSYTYDNNDKMIARLNEVNLQVQWGGYRRISMNYDASGNLVARMTEEAEILSLNSYWNEVLNELFSYDLNHNRTMHLYQSYSEESWNDSLRHTSAWNFDNQLTYFLTEEMTEGGWVNVTQMYYSHNADGFLDEVIVQLWDNQWLNDEKMTTGYDEQNRPESMMFFEWSEEWREYERYLFDYDTETRIHSDPASQKMGFNIANFPNPFNMSTTIVVDLPKQETISLSVLNIRGQKVKMLILEKTRPAGRFTAQWNGRNESGQIVPSGIYLIRLEGINVSQAEHCLLIK